MRHHEWRRTEMIELIVAAGAAYGGYRWMRKFFVRKLRFVPKARSRMAPWVAGAGAALIASPLAALPLITGLTAAAFGAGVAGGVYAGDREVERTDIWGGRRR